MDAPRPISFISPPSLIAFAALAVVCLTLSLAPLRTSHDEFWHLKTGRWIEGHGELPDKDIFTYTAADFDWHNHEWLSQIVMWKIYKAGERSGMGGLRAVIFFKAAFFTLSMLGLAVFLGWLIAHPPIAALAVCFAAALARRTLYPRPPFITYGLLALMICLLLAWRARRMRSEGLLALVPLFGLWANLHGGFAAGLVVGTAFWAEASAAWALAWWRREETRDAINRLGWITGVGLACALATLINPSGVHVYDVFFNVLGDEELIARIGELWPPNWRFVWAVDAVVIALLFAAFRPRTIKGYLSVGAGALEYLALAQARFWFTESGDALAEAGGGAVELWLREILIVSLILLAWLRSGNAPGFGLVLTSLFFAHQAIHHVRHLPLFGVAVAPLLAVCLADWVRTSVGGWDWIMRAKSMEMASIEGEGRLRARNLRAAAWAAALGASLLAGVYLFMPLELVHAVASAKEGEPWPKRTLLSVNLDLLRDSGGNANRDRGTEPGHYPKALVDFLIAEGLPGRIFNGGNYAGYLIWRLSPEKYKVFTDNRYDIYGGQFNRLEWDVLDGFEGLPVDGHRPWREILDEWGVNTLFIPMGSGLHARLRSGAGGADWSERAGDGGFVIWTRDEPIRVPDVEIGL